MRFISRKSHIEDVPPWPQQAESIRLLLIDDDEDEFTLLRETLAEIRGTHFDLEWISTYGKGLEAIIDGRHHAYLIDYRLGIGNGVELVREARAAGTLAPLIMVTGEGSRTLDMEAMDAGVSDFMEKGKTKPQVLERTIRYAITQAATTQALSLALRRISGVEQFGRMLAQDGPGPEALEELMRLVDEDFGGERSSLYLMDEGTLRLAAVRGYLQPLSQIDPRSGRLTALLASGRGKVIPNMTIDPEYRSTEDPMELCLPLVAEGTCFGILNTAWSEDESSADDAAGGLRLIADRLAVALALNRAIRGKSYT